MYSFIELLRALAAMLITNSHFDGVYPWNIFVGWLSGCSFVLFNKRLCSCKECSKRKLLPVVVEESDSPIYSDEHSKSYYGADRIQNAVY